MTEEQRLRRDVLRDVLRAAERRRDGVLPMDVEGVDTTFRDDVTLLGALELRWLARLSGRIERRLAKGPADVERTVVRAWAATAREMPGVRAILDQCADEPSSPEMAAVMATAEMREHMLLAEMAGHGGSDALRVGARLEDAGRDRYAETRGHDVTALRRRIKAVLAA